MSNVIQPYLFFGGRCEEALKFYGTAVGAEVVMLMRFKECPEPMPPGRIPAGWEDKVMHASFKINGSELMASDGCDSEQKFEGFSLSISVPDEAAAQKTFQALAEGGEITSPLAKTFWSPSFGMLTDRFGISWMVSVMHA